ncbi:hypothetical protein GWK47_005136 [Chionoecetes opilio]|uniref:Uncharacterized protein n=1 Tax=Chionoecetes opilio TaxID=41210 RepID=A0A8J4YAJ5_CHIOP|nr:hypothetical protein GWK47_005136 [Chionoecetes opilio]
MQLGSLQQLDSLHRLKRQSCTQSGRRVAARVHRLRHLLHRQPPGRQGHPHHREPTAEPDRMNPLHHHPLSLITLQEANNIYGVLQAPPVHTRLRNNAERAARLVAEQNVMGNRTEQDIENYRPPTSPPPNPPPPPPQPQNSPPPPQPQGPPHTSTSSPLPPHHLNPNPLHHHLNLKDPPTPPPPPPSLPHHLNPNPLPHHLNLKDPPTPTPNPPSSPTSTPSPHLHLPPPSSPTSTSRHPLHTSTYEPLPTPTT